jgi:DNA-binding response OmpR family regulator
MMVTQSSFTATTQPPGTAHVVIVDDEPSVANAIGMWMRMHQAATCIFNSGQAFLDSVKLEDGELKVACRDQLYPIRFVLFDLNMPVINGIELAHKVRALSPSMSITIMTAAMPDEIARHGPMPAGAELLIKPFRGEALQALLDR